MDICTPDLCDENPDDITVLDPLFTNYGGRKSFFGQVVTIKCFEDNSLVKEHAGYDGTGKVMVVDGGASLRKALLGDLIAANAVNNGCEGLVINGCIRDVDAIAELAIGVQALNTIPVKTEKRGVGDLNVPISFAGVTIHPGSYIYADNNGIIVSSKSLIS